MNTVFYTAVPPNFAWFFSYEFLNNVMIKYLRKNDKVNYNWLIPPISSSISEIFYLLLFVPADTVQTRI